MIRGDEGLVRPPHITTPEPDGDAHPILLMSWAAPDYSAILRTRMENLERIRSNPNDLPALKAWYRLHPDDMINDWGMTSDPRNPDIGLPTDIPFILFMRQREWVAWVMERWRARKRGICEKSRDMGVSWLAMSLSCTLCSLYDGINIGVGSRKTEYVDDLRSPKPLLPKARKFVQNLPVEFRAGYESWRDSPFMHVAFPDTGSTIGGEGGDDLGRGDRTTLYLVDETAHHPKQELIEASLSQTTRCRIDMSSVRGMNNLFAKNRWEGKIDVFIFDWRDDPRKDQAWYDKQCEEFDPVVVAQEIDRDYQASVSGVVIPQKWVRAAINAHKVLGIAPAGRKMMSLDVADEGLDKNALAYCEGTQIEWVEERSGKGGDIYETVEWAFQTADEFGVDHIDYDADGLGAGVRGDARKINETRALQHKRPIAARGFRGSESVFDPDGVVEGTIGLEGDKGRLNKDYYGNHKAQGWWHLRKLFRNTYRWVVDGIQCATDDIISISSDDPEYMKLVGELSQPTFATNQLGKIIINKKPDGSKSPNRADAVMIRYAPKELPPVAITQDMIAQVMRAGMWRRR